MTQIKERAIESAVVEAMACILPVGTMVAYLGHAAPDGWILCAGQEVSKTTYPKLYIVVGDWGGSATEGNFKVPDMRGISPCGRDNIGGSAASSVRPNTSYVYGSAAGTLCAATPTDMMGKEGGNRAFNYIIKADNSAALPDIADMYPAAPAVP